MGTLLDPPEPPVTQNSVFMDKFRAVVIGGVVVIVLGFGGLIFALTQVTGQPPVAEGEEGPSTAGISGGVEAEESASGAEVTEDAPGEGFKGEGKESISFKAQGGLAVIKLSHRGSANFIVHYGNGTAADTLLVNVIGSFDGSKAVGLEEGEYTIAIDTTGEWAVEVDQRPPADPPSAPQTLTGGGQSATSFFKLKPGTATFRLNHQGTGLFSPNLLRSDGSPVTLLANAVGAFNGLKHVEIPEGGVYVIDVTASGDWTIEVTQ